MEPRDFITYAHNTWCPGCGNFGILTAVTEVFAELVNEGTVKKEDIIITAGIGCHAKIADYLNTNSFYSLHGRSIAPATGIKLARPNSLVVAFAGDGDAYGEGISHLIFAAKRNTDITAIIHDNRIYALTTGQFAPTSPSHFPGRSTPKGSPEDPLNPIELMLNVGATFVARTFAGDLKHMKKIFKEAMLHKGFSFVDVLQPCVTFFNTYQFYRERVYDLQEDGHDPRNFDDALDRAREWNYTDEDKSIPIGIFYKTEKLTFEEQILRGKTFQELPYREISNILETKK